MAEPPGQMETMTEATARLRAAGYVQNWIAEAGALRCYTCATIHEPAEITVDEVVRFEGPSDPGDEAILFALTARCGHRGQYSAAYGPSASTEDAEILIALGNASS